MIATVPSETPKRERTRLAKSELLLMLATMTESWALSLEDRNPDTRPFAEWPRDDPFVDLLRRYDLTPADLARISRRVGAVLEARAIRSGYEEAWL